LRRFPIRMSPTNSDSNALAEITRDVIALYGRPSHDRGEQRGCLHPSYQGNGKGIEQMNRRDLLKSVASAAVGVLAGGAVDTMASADAVSPVSGIEGRDLKTAVARHAQNGLAVKLNFCTTS
jgi:hypothetical protein